MAAIKIIMLLKGWGELILMIKISAGYECTKIGSTEKQIINFAVKTLSRS